MVAIHVNDNTDRRFRRNTHEYVMVPTVLLISTYRVVNALRQLLYSFFVARENRKRKLHSIAVRTFFDFLKNTLNRGSCVLCQYDVRSELTGKPFETNSH